MSEDVAARAYVKYFRRGASAAAGEHPVRDEWDAGRFGFRVDWMATRNNEFTFLSNAYRGTVGQGVSLIASTSAPFDQPVYRDVGVS